MADDDPSEIHLHWEPPSENLIHRGGVDVKWNGPLRVMDVQSTACAIEFAPKIFFGGRGRPSFEIKEEQLSFLIDQGFQVPVIAKLFRVSPRTIERRTANYGLSISGRLF